MLFKEIQAKEKRSILKSWKYKITRKVILRLKDDGIKNISSIEIDRYVEYLLEDTHYDPYRNVFYDPLTKFKFTTNIFVIIACEYIMEHLDEFSKG